MASERISVYKRPLLSITALAMRWIIDAARDRDHVFHHAAGRGPDDVRRWMNAKARIRDRARGVAHAREAGTLWGGLAGAVNVHRSLKATVAPAATTVVVTDGSQATTHVLPALSFKLPELITPATLS